MAQAYVFGLPLQATEECAADKKNYQSELADMFARRIKKLEEDLKVLETDGSLDNVKPQVRRRPSRPIRIAGASSCLVWFLWAAPLLRAAKPNASQPCCCSLRGK